MNPWSNTTQPLRELANQFVFGPQAKSGSDPVEREHYAQLSDMAYMSPENRQAQAQLLGYQYDQELSDPYTAVFHRQQGPAVVAFRGTVPTHPPDLGADASILVGVQAQHPRFKQSLDLTNRVRTKHGPQVVLTGHSLGGAIAEHVSLNTDLPAIVYNPGSSPYFPVRSSPHTVVYRHPMDIVSSGYNDWPIPLWRGLIRLGTGDHSVTQFYDT
jgi:hypothetical protein